MSDLLAAAAAALGSPEAMVKRSAEARAKASGMTVDEVLAAWSGGATITAPPPATIPARPPVLVGRTDRPFRTLTAATGLFLVGSLLGFVAPVLLDASG